MDSRQSVIFQSASSQSPPENRTDILFSIKTRKPLDLFPDELVIDRRKVNLIRRPFFFTERIVSLAYEDISNVVIEHSLLFACLEISHKIFGMAPLQVRFLKRDEANIVKRLILGLMIAKRDGLKNLLDLKTSDLITTASQLGRAHSN